MVFGNIQTTIFSWDVFQFRQERDMEIIGWIRERDKAACGGIVVEGDQTCISHGRAYAFQGARVACPRNCVIADGYAFSTLTNGRSQVIHGMVTSGGCPLYSTLNDVDGVGNERGDAIAERHFLNADGHWEPLKAPGPLDATYDERPYLIAPPVEGVPYYIETMDGRTFSGQIGADGLLPRVDTYGEDEYKVYWGDDALAKMEGAKT
jgi:uncharacterized Zn-binding protein involved in type VI secretion